MAKKRRVTTLDIELTPSMYAYLQQLVGTELYGRTIEQCAEELLRSQLREVMFKRHQAGLDTTLGSAVRACRKCGCTDYRACPGGCSWVEDDLCSACYVEPRKRARR
jgi:hypothetical protein